MGKVDAFVAQLTAFLHTPLMDALAPAIVLGALLFAVLPWMPATWRPARVALTLISGALLLRYLVWRYEVTLPPMSEPVNWLAGWTFFIIEVLALTSALLSLMFLSRVRDRSAEADTHEGWERVGETAPMVDVLICTVNEEQRILEHTILGAIGMDYPNFRTWVLDDGKRPWLKALCQRLGVGYLTRPDNAHAKAGNINHALGVLAALPEPPQFVSILDADFVPTAHFLSRAMSLFHDDRVGIVQTPQHFINPDPIQTNLAIAGTWPDEQRYFFDIVMPGKDAWGTAFCCGTSSLPALRTADGDRWHPHGLGHRGLPDHAAPEGSRLHDRLSQRAAELRSRPRGPQGIRHPARPLVAWLHADPARTPAVRWRATGSA